MPEYLEYIPYFPEAFGDAKAIRKLVQDCRRELRSHDVQFNTMVGTGLSGALVVPVLARAMRKHFLIVRKLNDKGEKLDNSHSWHKAEGRLGGLWIFVDDFVCTGGTLERVKGVIKDLAQSKTGFLPIYPGTLLYHTVHFTPATRHP